MRWMYNHWTSRASVSKKSASGGEMRISKSPIWNRSRILRIRAPCESANQTSNHPRKKVNNTQSFTVTLTPIGAYRRHTSAMRQLYTRWVRVVLLLVCLGASGTLVGSDTTNRRQETGGDEEKRTRWRPLDVSSIDLPTGATGRDVLLAVASVRARDKVEL